ncbi:response regulator transcription factor [Elongatibacter sediminis]|uniref:Response regulator transcription factor n=1 Tax=Elongatibacter sediminis TaxID=3119006 RepID=A0AAW9R513_9GAMM
MSERANLVIAEDDEFVRDLLAATLEDAGFHVTHAGTGRELLTILDNGSCDLVLLDLGLPDEDGLVLMRQIRARSSIPIVVLTARRERDARLSALELGADDYLTKPCDPRELSLRVKNLLRRSSSASGRVQRPSAARNLEFEGWRLDLDARALYDQTGCEVHLPRSEFNLLAAMVIAPNRVLSRAQLLDAIAQHDSSPSERMVDVLVARLRRKIEADPKQPRLIQTVVGVGYKFSAKQAV